MQSALYGVKERNSRKITNVEIEDVFKAEEETAANIPIVNSQFTSSIANSASKLLMASEEFETFVAGVASIR